MLNLLPKKGCAVPQSTYTVAVYTKSDGDIVDSWYERASFQSYSFPRAKLRPSLYVALVSNFRRVKCNSSN